MGSFTKMCWCLDTPLFVSLLRIVFCPIFESSLLFLSRFLTDPKAPKSRWALTKILPTGANLPNDSQTRTATLCLRCSLLFLAAQRSNSVIIGRQICGPVACGFCLHAQTHFFFFCVGAQWKSSVDMILGARFFHTLCPYFMAWG